jgi:ankyrin repeat protein
MEWLLYYKVYNVISFKIIELSQNDDYLSNIINQKDLRQNTPLMLCILLRSLEVNL